MSAMAGVAGALRAVTARMVSAVGAYRPLEHAVGGARGGFVLAYHNLAAARFAAQIAALAPSRPIALDELVERHARGAPTRGLFAITFDDGVGETVREIAAAATAAQWPVTFYLPTGYLEAPGGMPFQWLRAIERQAPPVVIEAAGETFDFRPPGAIRAFARATTEIMYTRPWTAYGPRLRALADALVGRGLVAPETLAAPPAITWPEVEALARAGVVSFESHGITHTAVAALTDDGLEHELAESRRIIAEHTGRECRHFCYPYGGAASIGAVAPSRVARYYRSATTMTRGRLGRHALELLPRVPVYPHDDAALVRLKVLTA
ncbi:MAG: polysaccharide deacetylase family protein [Deltaproteobacteria bacterium]|nr:polysaccharide deacetylase family protein [Deltaproteobacteria bacterium]